MRGRRRQQAENGAALVEFALIAPVLIVVLLGIIEFGYILALNLDVKHGAREGARITAVNDPASGNAALAAEICSRMGLVGDDPTTVSWSSDGTPQVGEGVQVTVATNKVDSLTGLLDWAFHGLTSLESTVEIRIEQPPDWADGSETCP